MTSRLPILVLALVVASCSDTVRTEFKTLEDAKLAKAFDRGWLPPLLPDGSTDIVEENDLDINSGSGSFHFPSASTATYLMNLEERHDAVIMRSTSGITITIENSDTRWRIELDPQKETGTYSIQYRNKDISVEPRNSVTGKK